jgi:hypothetical protein
MTFAHEPCKVLDCKEAFLILVEDSEKLDTVIIRDRCDDLPESLNLFGKEDELSKQVGEDLVGLDGKTVAVKV